MFRSATRLTTALRTSILINCKVINSNVINKQIPLIRPFSTEYDPSKVINCAIIAHVDHGKFMIINKYNIILYIYYFMYHIYYNISIYT